MIEAYFIKGTYCHQRTITHIPRIGEDVTIEIICGTVKKIDYNYNGNFVEITLDTI